METALNPDKVRRILEKLKGITLIFARAQIAAGADSMTVADHATRDLCSPDAYRDFIMPIHAEFAKAIAVPIMLHICGHTSDRIGYISKTGIAAFHWDSKSGIEDIVKGAGENLALVGGTSNLMLLNGTPGDVEKDFDDKVSHGINVIGPECAVPLQTPLKNLAAFAATRKRKFPSA
jgi:[methyl-Co(III) methanol-specific corrinoid protein]:coenzyme M methyltransferase